MRCGGGEVGSLGRITNSSFGSERDRGICRQTRNRLSLSTTAIQQRISRRRQASLGKRGNVHLTGREKYKYTSPTVPLTHCQPRIGRPSAGGAGLEHTQPPGKPQLEVLSQSKTFCSHVCKPSRTPSVSTGNAAYLSQYHQAHTTPSITIRSTGELRDGEAG